MLIPTAARPAESLYLSTATPPALARLSLPDTHLYLARIDVSPSILTCLPSLDILSTIMLAHVTHIPYDTSALHVLEEDWKGPLKPIVLAQGRGMQAGAGNFDRMVRKKRGGHCYSNNGLFAAVLRGFGFGVEEVGARVYLPRGKDPREVGYVWSAITHEALIVSWEGSEGSYLVDVGFGGGGCPFPILLKDGQTSPSLSPCEAFLLTSETLPSASLALPGWTFSRRVVPPHTVIPSHSLASEGPGYWSPCYHFTLSSLCPTDIAMGSFYNERCPTAPFMSFFVVSILLPSGSRKSLIYGTGNVPEGMSMGDGGGGKRVKAKLYEKEGIKGEEREVRWVEFETESVRKVLKEEFGYEF